jgi:hypothetical protein
MEVVTVTTEQVWSTIGFSIPNYYTMYSQKCCPLSLYCTVETTKNNKGSIIRRYIPKKVLPIIQYYLLVQVLRVFAQGPQAQCEGKKMI